MHWELWSAESNNLIECFDTEDEGLQAVHETLAVNKPDYVEFLGLVAMYDEGESHDVELPPALYGETLRARLAEWVRATNYEASREVHQKIMNWLAEEGWTIRDVDDLQASFNIMVVLQDGASINIYQYFDHRDHITLNEHVIYDEQSRAALSELPVDIRRETEWSVYRDVSLLGIDCDEIILQQGELRYTSSIYFDGLTKDSLIQKIRSILRAVDLSTQTFRRGLEQAGQSVEDASQLLRLAS